MTTDIQIMGPHALASYESRILALQSFGVNPLSLVNNKNTTTTLAKQSASKRALMVQEDHQIVSL